jgi:hypothetical protein
MDANNPSPSGTATTRLGWNKGKIMFGQSAPSRRLRDLALFNLEIDSKLRGCDLVTRKAAAIGWIRRGSR